MAWLRSVDPQRRSIVYYSLNSRFLHILKPEDVDKDFELLNYQILECLHYVGGVNSSGTMFLPPTQLLERRDYQIRFFGRKGESPQDDRMVDQARLIVEYYYPQLDIRDTILGITGKLLEL
jgi:hypothetical protein